MRYFLIGFMGAGKSEIGKKLSVILQLKHIDLDQYIEEAEKKKIYTIFHQDGEKSFRELEKKYLLEIIKEDNILISTGGGTPVFNDLIDYMNKCGTTIYIRCPEMILYNRLKSLKKMRPLISSLSNISLKKYIEKTLNLRDPYYKKSKYTINNDGEIEGALDQIIEKLR